MKPFIGGVSSVKRGRGAEGKALILIGVEDTGEGIGRIRLSQISDASGEVLNTSIQQMVSIGTQYVRMVGMDIMV